MRITLFLGAGASKFAGLPTTADLLLRLRDRLRKLQNESDRDKLLQDYVEDIVDAKVYTDLEKLYDGVKTIIDMQANPNCEPIANGFQYHYTKKFQYRAQNVDTVTTPKFIPPASASSPPQPRSLKYEEINNELDKLLGIIRYTILHSFDIKQDTHKSIVEMYDMVWEVIKRNGTDKFQIFTTNYDTVMDTYATAKGFETIDGFGTPHELREDWTDEWSPTTDKPPLYLAKLHGSIRWYRKGDTITKLGGVSIRDAADDIMIAPTEGAKRYDDAPFSALMTRFRDALQDTDVLLVIGFSYRDREIVSNIKDRLSKDMVLISVSPTTDKDIHQHVSDVKPKTRSANLNLDVIEPNIILCKQNFEPENRDMLHTSLDDAFELAVNMRSHYAQTRGFTPNDEF